MIDYRQSWNGRTVKFAEFDCREGRTVIEAFGRDRDEGSYTALALSCRYADDDSRVFASADEVWAAPFRLQERIFWLAAQAMRLNGMLPDPPEGEPEGGARPNGSEAPGPSH